MGSREVKRFFPRSQSRLGTELRFLGPVSCPLGMLCPINLNNSRSSPQRLITVAPTG